MPSTYGSILSYLKGTGIGQLHVVTSKGVWPPQSLLQSLVVKSRFVGRGFQASKGLISVHFHTPHPQRCRTHICPEVELGNKASIFNPSQGSLTGLLCSEYSRTRNNQRSHRSRYVVRPYFGVRQDFEL